RNATQTFAGSTVSMGDCAAVRLGGIEVVLISDRTQGFGPDLFGNCGIDPATRRILVVKSTNHFHAGFAPIAADVLYVDSEGPIPGLRISLFLCNSWMPRPSPGMTVERLRARWMETSNGAGVGRLA